jgi:DNA-binding FadR family transcriptional regulator
LVDHSAEQTVTRVVQELQKYLLSSLADGSLTRGSRLPSERVLAHRFHFPRGGIRDALAVLQAEGFVERRHGSGTFVTGSRGRYPSLLDNGDVSPADLLEARLALEPQFAELVVANATTADFAIIEDCNRHTAGATTAEQFSYWNRRLHQAIAAATRNEFLIQVFGLVARAQQHPSWGELSRRPTSRELRREYQKEHDRIVMSLRARNVEAARAAISNHLKHARQVLLG